MDDSLPLPSKIVVVDMDETLGSFQTISQGVSLLHWFLNTYVPLRRFEDVRQRANLVTAFVDALITIEPRDYLRPGILDWLKTAAATPGVKVVMLTNNGSSLLPIIIARLINLLTAAAIFEIPAAVLHLTHPRRATLAIDSTRWIQQSPLKDVSTLEFGLGISFPHPREQIFFVDDLIHLAAFNGATTVRVPQYSRHTPPSTTIITMTRGVIKQFAETQGWNWGALSPTVPNYSDADIAADSAIEPPQVDSAMETLILPAYNEFIVMHIPKN